MGTVQSKEHKSLIDNTPQCHHCGSEINLQRHHMLKGLAYRYKAEEDGLWCYLCSTCHAHLHGKNGHELDLQYKQEAQRAWMKHFRKGIKEFRQRYGKSYL